MLDIEKDYRFLLENIEGFLVIDKDEKLLYLTEELAQQVGSTQEEAIGKPLKEIIPTNNTGKVIQTGKKNIGEVYFVQGYTVVANAIPLYKKGELVGALEYDIFKNASELHSFLDRISELSNELDYYKSEVRNLRGARYSIGNIIGESNAIKKLKIQIELAAKNPSTVLITGETGCGKELVAHAIHKLSERGLRNFIRLNCAAIPDNLFEAELFGYEEGTFTGGKKGGKKGKVELSDGGTLMLDEVHQLSKLAQPKLLRFLQEGEYIKLGGDFSKYVNTRIIATSNMVLSELVANDEFRQDLYYRLNIINIRIPPLRERLDDIPLLVQLFLSQFNNTMKRFSHVVRKVDPRVLKWFYEYNWPGNIRELQNVLEQAYNNCYEEVLKPEHFEYSDTMIFQQKIDDQDPTPHSLQKIKKDAEMKAISRILQYSKGNISKAARLLDISRQTLHKKIKDYKIGIKK
jgi:transcriptional regulator with PAS, ATPase and Fis domain